MVRSLEDYIDIVGPGTISAVYKKARRLYGKRICHINSTFLGGGVAEILSRSVPLMNEVGIDADWRIIHGNPAFFDITKKFHNALQSGSLDISPMEESIYAEVNEEFAGYTHLENYQCTIVHDPQPLPLIKYYKKQEPWIWRCHIDITNPHGKLWEFLKKYLLRYDLMIVSSEKYLKPDLPVEQRVIHPAIDPLSLKNRDLSDEEIATYVKKAGIPTDKPIIAQVSRMDPWKDPEGVLEVYKRIREKVDCRLLYCYNLASDDPEGMKIYQRVHEKAKGYADKGDVVFVLGNNDLLVNAVQRFSDVIIQKSTKEGFALTVTEALWKGKPVVAGNVGGIPHQIRDGKNGFLVDPRDYDACAAKIVKLLQDRKYAAEIGKNAKEFVRKHFLITRLMSDYLDLVTDVLR